MARLEVVCLTNGVFSENCYLVADGETGDAAVIDPGEDVPLFERRLAHMNWTARAIWLTHAHLDHVAGVAPLVESLKLPVFLHPADRQLYDGTSEQGRFMGVPVDQPPPPDHELLPGQLLSLGGLAFEIRHVPGHSPGSVALIGHGVAFVGDALFAGSVGRVDLPGGDGATLLTSIREQLLTLPDDTIVYSGHGPETTIGAERVMNPFVTGAYPLA